MVNTGNQTKVKLIEVLVAGNHIKDLEIGAGRENRLAEIIGSRQIAAETEIVVAVRIRGHETEIGISDTEMEVEIVAVAIGSRETEKGISEVEMEVEIGTLVAVAIRSRETEKRISEIEMGVRRGTLVAVAIGSRETEKGISEIEMEVGIGNSDIQTDMMIAGNRRERERTKIGVDLEADQRPEKG